MKCKECGIKVVGNRNLNKHYLAEHKDKMLKCPECDYLSISKGGLYAHRIARHKKKRKGNKRKYVHRTPPKQEILNLVEKPQIKFCPCCGTALEKYFIASVI